MLFLVILQSVLLVALLGLVLCWRLQTNRSLDRVSALEREKSAAVRNLQVAISNFQAELTEIKDREPRRDPYPVEPPTASQTLTIGKRSQAIKMIRRGESVENVAAAIGAPQSQIRLLMKVHALIGFSSAPT